MNKMADQLAFYIEHLDHTVKVHRILEGLLVLMVVVLVLKDI